MSLDLMGTTSAKAFMVDSRFWCERITPLGMPVEPDVYMMMAGSLGLGGTEAERTNIQWVRINIATGMVKYT